MARPLDTYTGIPLFCPRNTAIMKSDASTPEEYLSTLPEDRKEMLSALRNTFLQHLPPGFQETMAYGMITFTVPHTRYPKGYHCDPKQALPFISIASQKNFIAVYHMGLYARPDLLNWFTQQYGEVSKTKLDMGKSCVRFKKPEQIPLGLLGELASKMTVDQWIETYEKSFTR